MYVQWISCFFNLLKLNYTLNYIFVNPAGTNGFPRAECSSITRRMYRNKEKSSERTQISSLLRRTKREIQRLKHRDEGAKGVERKMRTVGRALPLPTKVQTVLARVQVAQ